ncbi:accessory gene regulator B family protein [Clostridium estertheticum]|uniref:accessory gene regulator B family protein n=1 Tax=Clostridium estertheticum TaxID=238834 RepID=UPI001C7D2CA5|nr:accessory gene regulator B family protein [Clostridium estertheticum]MBX4267243.1 accessory gene regulator B family protein [Clostridium estertheticum]MBX4272198.1 accessory gene regulator B family protein [Clostridium estertheticum]WLC82360.1 accessory gene regulator B family protein [Clostridium estertheticum]WLC91238.1 accessory gene regulator B family protein [Clostridium estertheticum]
MRTKGNLHFDFYEFITTKLLNYFKNYLDLKSSEIEKLYLGIIIIMINVGKLLIIAIIAYFIGMIKEVLILFVMFGALRLTAAGIHLKSDLGCTVVSLIAFIGSAYITVKYPLSISLTCIISIICTVLLYKYSPADTENRPILKKEHRKKLKIKATVTALVFIVINLLLLNKVLFNLTMFALLLQSLSISPWTYKLLKSSYNNYEKYEVI